MIDLSELPTGWKYCRGRWDAIKGKKMIYKLKDDGSYVISENGVWIAGVYANISAALMAFKMDDEVLYNIQKRKNIENSGPITVDDFKEERK